jgi:hypothetical protein
MLTNADKSYIAALTTHLEDMVWQGDPIDRFNPPSDLEFGRRKVRP